MATRQRILLACVCAVAVATVYGIQPVLETAGTDLGLSRGTLGWLVAAGQFGYFAGLVLLVPLGDLYDRRRLIAAHLLFTAVGAAVTAVASNGATAIAGLALAGLFAVVVQTTVAYVATVSPPGERGRNIGVVTSGVVIGILGVRVIAGIVTEASDWRVVYLGLAGLCAALAVAVRFGVAAEPRRDPVRYPEQLTALGRLVARDRLFRRHGLVTFFLFASFGTLWSGLALPLGDAPWHLGPTEIGLFGLAGLTGALGAARAGRWADRGRASAVIGGSLALLVVSWLFTGQARWSLWLLIVGVIVLDFAVQAVHVSNQHQLTLAHPRHSSGVIGGNMAFYSLGSALGAITTTAAYNSGAGWTGVSVLGATYAGIGLLVAVSVRRLADEAAAAPALPRAHAEYSSE